MSNKMKVEITLTEEMLGTACGNKQVYTEMIGSKSADADKLKEELSSLPTEELEAKGRTVFHRDEKTGRPFLYDYQVKGFFKEAVGIQCDLNDAEIKIGKTKLSKYSHKKIVDNFLFIGPRKIYLSNDVGEDCVRPLRADTMRGERVALACSETVPAGTTFTFEMEELSGSLSFWSILCNCLDYGKMKGFGQWRNSGKGRFNWKRID